MEILESAMDGGSMEQDDRGSEGSETGSECTGWLFIWKLLHQECVQLDGIQWMQRVWFDGSFGSLQFTQDCPVSSRGASQNGNKN